MHGPLNVKAKAGLYHVHLRDLNAYLGTRTIYSPYVYLDLSTCSHYDCLLFYTMGKTYEKQHLQGLRLENRTRKYILYKQMRHPTAVTLGCLLQGN